MIRNLILAAVCLLATATPTSAGDVSDFDIMDIRIGMTAKEVEEVAGENRLEKSGTFPAPSFDQQAAIGNGSRVAASDYAGLQSMELESDAKQVEVFFVPSPEGPKAWKIVYRYLGSDLTREAMSDRVIETYGPPDKKVMGRAVWGDTALPFSRKSAWLEYDDNPPTARGQKPVGVLTLSDPDIERKAKAAIKAFAEDRR